VQAYSQIAIVQWLKAAKNQRVLHAQARLASIRIRAICPDALFAEPIKDRRGST